MDVNFPIQSQYETQNSQYTHKFKISWKIKLSRDTPIALRQMPDCSCFPSRDVFDTFWRRRHQPEQELDRRSNAEESVQAGLESICHPHAISDTC